MASKARVEHLPDGMIRVVIPGMRIVSESNVREHWSKSHKRHSNQRWITAQIVRGVGRLPPVRVVLVYHSSRKMDQGNIAIAFKHVQDGIADALGVDDGDDDYYQWVYQQQVGTPLGKSFVEILFVPTKQGK